MIEIKAVRRRSEEHYVLIVNGSEVSGEDCTIRQEKLSLRIFISNFDVYELMWPYSLSQVLLSDTIFLDTEIHIRQIEFDFNDSTSSLVLRRSNKANYEVGFDLNFDYENWGHVWSVQEYIREVQRKVESSTKCVTRWQQSDPETLFNGYIIYFTVNDPEVNLADIVLNLSAVVEELQDQALAILGTRFKAVGHDDDALIIHCDFPEEVKTPCEQYLLYFVQFLKDLGIDSTADLQHEAGQVLFSVTPNNKEQAL